MGSVPSSSGASPLRARPAFTVAMAQERMVSVRSPRKSNLTRPAASTSSLSNWVMTLPPPGSQYSGVKSVSTDGAITTPPACLPALRVRPSSERARSSRVAHLLILLVEPLELGLLGERIIERNAELERNQFGDAVDEAVGMSEHAADIAHHGLGGHGAVGDDLRHAIVAVLGGHVLDHAVAALHAEVDVEVRHRDAFGIQEALEQQVVAQRLDVRDAQRVGDQRAGARAASGAHRHAVIARPADEIRNDQKVAGKAHRADHVELAARRWR
jgi:hypothetical protein